MFKLIVYYSTIDINEMKKIKPLDDLLEQIFNKSIESLDMILKEIDKKSVERSDPIRNNSM